MAEEKKFQCSGDCLNCRINPNERRTQWQYCAAQFAYNAVRMIQDMQNGMKTMSDAIAELKEKVDAIQNSDTTVFAPHEENSEIPKKHTAQKGDGAKE